MFGISASHLIILAIILLIFGPKRLPELGQTMGKALRNFKDALSGVEDAKFTRLDETNRAPNAPVAPATPATAHTSDGSSDASPPKA